MRFLKVIGNGAKIEPYITVCLSNNERLSFTLCSHSLEYIAVALLHQSAIIQSVTLEEVLAQSLARSFVGPLNGLLRSGTLLINIFFSSYERRTFIPFFLCLSSARPPPLALRPPTHTSVCAHLVSTAGHRTLLLSHSGEQIFIPKQSLHTFCCGSPLRSARKFSIKVPKLAHGKWSSEEV